MRRRAFITLLSGAAAWPLAARAQQSGKLPKIGLLSSGAPAVQGQWVPAFVQRLRELGWIEGRTVVLEVRWAEGRPERFTEIAAEFVRLKVEVIMTYSTAAVIAAKQATSIIPIIFAAANDPIGSGLVASLARPGGNVTGLSLQSTDIAAKRFELLREVVPGVRRLAMLTNSLIPAMCWRAGRFKKRPAASHLGWTYLKSSERRILRRPLRGSRVRWTRFMLVPTRS